MTYMFAGAFCEFAEDRDAALRRAFPDGIVGVFHRSDPCDSWMPAGSSWCPARGLLAICRPTEFTVDDSHPTQEYSPDDDEAFFHRLQQGLPALSTEYPCVAMLVECWGGDCGVSVSTFRNGSLDSSHDCGTNTYANGLVDSLRTIGCELNAHGVFPPLSRGAFTRFC